LERDKERLRAARERAKIQEELAILRAERAEIEAEIGKEPDTRGKVLVDRISKALKEKRRK
jgi:hypothetical protein